MAKNFSLIRLGIPIGLTYFVEVSAFCIVGLLIARFGVIQMSANQIALNFSSLLIMVPVSFGMALITRVGQTLGEGDPLKARFISLIGIGFSLIFSLFSALFMAIFRFQIACLYTSDKAVQELTATLIIFIAIFQLSDAMQIVASCAIRGYKITMPLMLIHLSAFYGFALPLGCVLGLAPSWIPWRPIEPIGVIGFWIGLTVGLTISAILQFVYFQNLSLKKIKGS